MYVCMHTILLTNNNNNNNNKQHSTMTKLIKNKNNKNARMGVEQNETTKLS